MSSHLGLEHLRWVYLGSFCESQCTGSTICCSLVFTQSCTSYWSPEKEVILSQDYFCRNTFFGAFLCQMQRHRPTLNVCTVLVRLRQTQRLFIWLAMRKREITQLPTFTATNRALRPASRLPLVCILVVLVSRDFVLLLPGWVVVVHVFVHILVLILRFRRFCRFTSLLLSAPGSREIQVLLYVSWTQRILLFIILCGSILHHRA